MKLKLSEVTIDAGTQSRRKIDQSNVMHYAQLMADGVVFPPIVVFGEKHILADGWHRYWACRKAGIKEIEVVSKEGTIRDAIYYGISANNEHGLPMTQQDRQDNARKLLMDAEWSKLGVRTIADKVGLSKSTVSNIRNAMEAEGRIEKVDTRTYIRDGQEIITKVATKEPLEPLQPQEGSLPEPIFDSTQGSRAEDLQQIKELSDVVGMLEEENQKLKDAVAIGSWDATDIEKEDIEETVKELRNQIKILEMENATLRSSRDMYMNQAAELERINKGLRNKLKKFEQ